MLGFTRDQVLSVVNIGYIQFFFGYVGLQLAQKSLPGPAFALTTMAGMALFGFLSQHATNKAIAKVVGKENFVNPKIGTSIQIDTIRGAISWAGIMALYAAVYYALPLIPISLTDRFSWLAQFASGDSSNSLLFFLIIALLITTLNGGYHLKVQKEIQHTKPRKK